MNILFLYLNLSLIALSYCVDVMYNHTNQENNLYFVFTTFRHGARKPLFGKDYFGNSNYLAGALTTYGRIQHLEIGRKYRKRYSNFVNISFDKNELYIRSSNIGRTIVSTEKELEGFFNKTIDRSNIAIVVGGLYFMNLFHLDPKEQAEMNKYVASCPKRKLGKNYGAIYYTEILPNVKKCHMMENIKDTGVMMFCDSVISHYFEYYYGNETYNIIGRCSKENIQKFYNFCVDFYNTFRGWNELGAYMFYMLFQNIFKYMDNYINGRSKIKMIMIGGHDVTVAPLMDFLSGLKIIPRTHFPHYACNIVIEFRKYGQDFYIEFYYNDILKYNNTLEKFKSILDNSKYSNLYNYCGLPSTNQTLINETLIGNIKNTTNQTINNQTLLNETIIGNIKNTTNQAINNQTLINETIIGNIKNKTNQTLINETNIDNIKNETLKNETKIDNIKNETNQTLKNDTKIENVKNEEKPTVNIQTEENGNNTIQREDQSIQNSTKGKNTEKVKFIENNPNKNLLNNNDVLNKKNETSRENQGKNFTQKSFNYLAQQNMNFYVMVICTFVVICTLIIFAIFVFIWRKNRKKRYIKFKEAVAQNVNPNNISIMTSNDSKIKSEPQSND